MAQRTSSQLCALLQVVFIFLAVIWTEMGNAQNPHPSGEEKMASYPQSQQTAHASHKVYPGLPLLHRPPHGSEPQQQVPQGPDMRQPELGSDVQGRQHAVQSGYSRSQYASGHSKGGSGLDGGSSYSYSNPGSQVAGGHSVQSSYSFEARSSSYRSSESKASASSSSNHGDSAQLQGESEASGGASHAVSRGADQPSGRGSVDRSSHMASASVTRHSQRYHARSGSADDKSAQRSQNERQDSVGGQSQSHAQSSLGIKPTGHSQSSHAASSRLSSSSVRKTAHEEVRGKQSSSESSASHGMSDLDKVSALSADTEQRSYFRQLLSRRCKDCTLKGQTYRGHSRFEYTEGCQLFRCICNCNGSYTCPPRYTLTVCKEGEEGGDGRTVDESRHSNDLRRRRCQSCEVLGQQFEGNAYFDVQDGCTKYRGCICYCNGTWTCPSERAINTCQQTTPAPICRACNAKGKVVAANSFFELEEPCRRYRYCRCHCNGSWACPARFAENTCQSPTVSPQEREHPGCRKCRIPNNQQVQGNSYFQMTDGCMVYKNCVCRCNGSWTCPSQYARNTCVQPDRGEIRSNVSHLPVNSAECQSCLAYGRYFRGNTYFNTRQGCTSFERCVCRCDGSWDCPSRYVTNLCEDSDPSNDVDNPNATCSFCDAGGKIIPSNSFFNLTQACVRYTQCLCHCDGRWACPERFSSNVCEQPSQQVVPEPEPEKGCRSCSVDGRVVRGNSYFDFISSCFKYRDCLCKCDGTYHCEQERAENICNFTTAVSRSSPSSPSTAVTAAPASSCMRCFAFGQLHEADTAFVHEEDCVEYECHCHCNGTYTCPLERARRTCQPDCRECEVGGQFFEGNTYFQHTQGCVVYLCTCFCNGSYTCPSERANNTCEGPQGSVPRLSSASDVIAQSAGRDRAECQQCQTKDGRSHEPDTDFELREGCIHYQCRCHCDGSWNCPGHTARNACRGEVLGGCQSCVLSDSQIYHGGEDFQMRQGCIHYMCHCRCDGSWQCPGDQARDICLGEVPGGCRVCRVSKNETYRGGSAFQLRQACYHYQCQCHCNGSWECPGDTARDVCIGEVPGGCRVCRLDGGEIYPGETDFEMEKNCIHYNCRCNCDGSWDCPGERARRVCNADGSPLIEQAVTTTQPPPSRCDRCMVSDREQFTPNESFTLRRGCNWYQCDCHCDGSWNCPPDRTRNICRRREDPNLRAQTCSSCRVSSYTYPGRSSFLLTRGCAQYSCQCDCRGHWSCNHTVARNICQDDRQRQLSARESVRTGAASREAESRVLSSVSSAYTTPLSRTSLVSDVRARAVSTARGSSVSAASVGSSQPASQASAPCRPCRVDDRDFSPNTDFVLNRKCKRFNCFCSCNGRWRCPRQRTVNLCADEEQQEGERKISSVRRQQVPEEAGGQRYGRTNVRVIGANAVASSSPSSSSSSFRQVRREGEEAYGDVYVRGYYVNSAPQSSGQNNNRQVSRQAYRQADNRRVGLQAYKQADNRIPLLKQGVRQAYSHADNRMALLEQGGHSEGGSVPVGEEGDHSEDGSSCTPCQVDDKMYRTGAKFDWRRGCVIYKCSCLCSGSYRCRLSLDPECSQEEATPETGGIPTGPAAGGKPASQPGGKCGNCYFQGLVYPGNMSFTLRQGCQELQCQCHCGGNHECADQKPIPGCVAMSTPLGGAVYPYRAASSVYPIGGGGYVVRPGRVINAFQQTFISSCPACQQGQEGPLLIPALLAPQQSAGQNQNARQAQAQYLGQNQNAQQVSGQYRYPLAAEPQQERDGQSQVPHPGQGSNLNPVHPQNPRQPQSVPARFLSRTSVQRVPMQPVDVADSMPEKDRLCATCFVNGESRRGSFEYIKDCYQVTCSCDCSGRLHCSVQQAQMEDCPPQLGPLSGQCRSCVVHSHEYPPRLQFALRVGCYGYNCTCGCDGLWMCPRQQPTNYCVRPASSPAGVEEPRQVLAMESGQGMNSRDHHSHPEGKAGLEDATFSRTAQVSDNSLLSCRDCEVHDTTYPSRKRFLLMDGCLQHTCDCACDGSWACPKPLTIDVCQQGQSQAVSADDNQGLRKRLQQENEERPRQLHCKPCLVDGQHIRSRTAFSRRQGCWEFLCQCECNGTWTCPPDRSLDVCQLESPAPQSPVPHDPKGCRVGRKTFFTRLFAFRDGCVQHMCICYDSGAWRCVPGKERQLC